MRLSTKDNYEREDQEAERLVRPEPKQKPPRRDRRRERVQDPDAEKDPDLKGDPDLSLNYKTIGGNVARRWLEAKSRDKRVPAWNKKDKERVLVSPKTLKERPDVYEPYKDQGEGSQRQETGFSKKVYEKLDELEAGDPNLAKQFDFILNPPPGGMSVGDMAKDAPYISLETRYPGAQFPEGVETLGDLREALLARQKARQEAEAEPPEPEKEEPAPEPSEPAKEPSKAEDSEEKGKAPAPKVDPETRAWMETGGHESDDFQQFADQDPTVSTRSDGVLLFVDPSTNRKVPFGDLPPEEQDSWYGKFEQQSKAKDFSDALRDAARGDPAVRKVLEDLVDPESELSQRLKEQKNVGLADPAKVVPELKGKLPPDLHNMSDLAEAAQRVFEPPAKRKPLSEGERAKTLKTLTEGLPAHMLRGFFDQDLTPDEAKEVVRQFEAFKKESREWSDDEQEEFLEEAGRDFQTNPGKVPPPKTVERGGKQVPFEKLPKEEQAKVWREHQQSVALRSLVAQMLVAQRFDDVGSDDVARSIATFHLKKNQGQSDEERAREAAREGDRLFVEVVSLGSAPPLSDKAVFGILDYLEGDPAAQSLAAAALQARDYQSAKHKFLGAGGVTEHDPPSKIISGLAGASKWLRDRARRYPDDARGRDVARLFQRRVLDRLKTLAPEKYEKVRAGLEEREAAAESKQYEKAKKRYDKALAKYEKALEKIRSQNEAAMRAYERELEAWSEGYRQKGGQKPRKPKLEEPPDRPEPPKPPRSISSSTCRIGQAMKRALYHGVEPGSVGPYPRWRQVSQHDLTAADQAMILDVARGWLADDFLKAFEGTVRDTQLRAALDIAVATANAGAFARAVSLPLYNALLAQLAGVPEDETLLTVRSDRQSFDTGGYVGRQHATTRSNNMSTPKISAEQKTAANIALNRLDRIAQTVQAKHEAWGMPFEEAKAIVNALDRTADEIEIATFGKESFERRRAEVLQREQDEPYMDTFENPQAPIQTDADEPYMQAYADDQSSDVIHGVSETGRPLAPGHQ